MAIRDQFQSNQLTSNIVVVSGAICIGIVGTNLRMTPVMFGQPLHMAKVLSAAIHSDLVCDPKTREAVGKSIDFRFVVCSLPIFLC